MNSPASTGSALAATVLDHVAIAVEQWSDAWPRYVHQLGGTWHSGGVNSGFSPAQLSFANGSRVEILQPWEPESNPFLRRFLDHSGPGPHHLTFKVPDIDAMLVRVRGAGFEPVGVRLSEPQWREAFLHPREATGVVVQVAQAASDWVGPAPEGFPAPPSTPPASLLHVTHALRDLGTGLALFADLLGGAAGARGEGPGGAWEYADLSWPGPLAIRLVAPTTDAAPTSALRRWLGERPGRVHHLAFSCPGPLTLASDPDVDGEEADVAGVLPGPGAVRVIEPAHNLGTRLVLRTP